MRNASLYRVGGTALLIGAIGDIGSVAIHAPQPQDLATYASLGQGMWMASHWLFIVSNTLLVGGLFALARHLFSTKNEGWAILGSAAVLTTGALFAGVVAPEVLAFPVLAQSADPAAAQSYTAVNLNLMSLMHVSLPIFWGGVACLAVAMAGDSAFKRGVAQAGMALAVVEIVVPFTPMGENWTVFRLILAIGFAWLAVVGLSLRNVKSTVPSF